MPEHTLFHIAFLCQVLIVSVYLPAKILGRMRHIFDTYPPSSHPKQYPRPIESYGRSRRNFRLMNRVILVAGLILLAVLMNYSRSGKWDHVIAMWFFFLQCFPVMLLDLSSLREARLMRDSSTTRKAELRPRRLFDFVSPATIANVFFAGIAFRQIYGKKLNPHQAFEDRARQIRTVVHTMVFVSIAATVFIALAIVLAAFDSRVFQPPAQSVYFQLLAVVSFRVYLVNYSNFEVYREDPLAT